MKNLLLLFSLTALLAACGSNEDTSNGNTDVNDDVVENREEVVESEYPFPADATPIGDASIVISTPDGTSEDENVPTLFVSEDDIMTQIGIDYANFDGSKETFVYINEHFNTSEQVGEAAQSTLTLSEPNLEPGEYTVTAVQYEDNDRTKEPIALTQAAYKIKRAS